MAAVIRDRVQEATATAGTGAIALAGASAGFVAFGSVMGNGDTCRYCITDPVTGAWEVGVGTYTSGSNSLSRTTVEASSNAGALVNLAGSAGTVVFLDLSAAQIAKLAAVPVTSVSSSGASQALSFPANGNVAYDITLTADCALTLSGGVSGQMQQITVLLRQDGAAGHTPTPPSGINWRSGAPPTPNTAPGRFDLWTLATLDGGTTVLGSY